MLYCTYFGKSHYDCIICLVLIFYPVLAIQIIIARRFLPRKYRLAERAIKYHVLGLLGCVDFSY